MWSFRRFYGKSQLLAALYHPVWSSSIRNTGDMALALVAFGLLMYWKVPTDSAEEIILRWFHGTYFAYALGGLEQADQRAWFRLEEKRAVPNGTDPYPRLKI